MKDTLNLHSHFDKLGTEWLIKYENLVELNKTLGDQFPNTEVFLEDAEEVFLNIVTKGENSEKLNMLPKGGWQIKVSDNLLKTAFSMSILYLSLGSLGFSMLPGYVFPAVIPLLIDIEKIRLSPKDQHLLLELTRWDHVIEHGNDPEALYALLPETSQQQVPYLDFLDFLDQLKKAGFAQEAGADKLVLFNPDYPKFKLTIV